MQPPFVAPPTDGARQRRWLAVGLAGAAVLVCCLGGVVGAGGVVVLGNQMVLDQARGTVADYLTAIQSKDYAGAYGLLCDDERTSIDEAEFVDMFESRPALSAFTVGEAAILGDELVVPATLTYTDRRSDSVRYLISQDASTAEFEVCGQRD